MSIPFCHEPDFIPSKHFPIEELRMAVSNSEDVKQLMLDMIQEMDLDIVDFRVVEDENDRIDVYTKHLVDGFHPFETLHCSL